jgi:hypothetical protein
MYDIKVRTMAFMSRILGTGAVCMAMCTSLLASPAQAAYVVNLEQVGNNVVATGSGSIDTLGLSGPNLGIESTFLQPVFGSIFTGPPANSVLDTVYSGFTGPLFFGDGTGSPSPDSGSGDIVGLSGSDGQLSVPSGYVSGSPLSSTSTYLNTTLAVLGATPGAYLWTWGFGGDVDTFTLNVGATASPGPIAAPEPASAPLLGSALAGLLLIGTIRRARFARTLSARSGRSRTEAQRDQ